MSGAGDVHADFELHGRGQAESSALSVDVTVSLGQFTLRTSFRSGGSCTGIFGVSGAGKSTLLEVVAGLRPAVGTIRLGGRAWLDTSQRVNLLPESRGVGYVPQEGLLFPHWSVHRNILAGAGRRGRARGIDPDQVIRVLDLHALLDRDVGGLSGGERQRVALARALCSEPSLLLLDEPLGSIDRSLRSRILPYLLTVKETFAIPTLFVSHDAAEVEILCDDVLVIHRGRIVATGQPHEIFTGPEVAEALPGDAYENVLEGAVVRTGGDTIEVLLDGGPSLTIRLPDGLEAGAKVLLGIRASEILIALEETPGLSARNVLPGTVRSLLQVDGGDLVRVAVGGKGSDVAVMVTHAARQALGLREGAPVRLVTKARSFRLLAVR